MRKGARVLVAGVFATAAVVSAACTLLTGVNSLGEVACAECGAPDGPAGASDSRPPPSPSDGCVATGPEICTDGIDNDCNGYVDCQDPACSAFACTPPVPVGWTLALLDPSGTPPCPTGYATAMKLVVDPNLAAATCACNCTPGSPPSCVDGVITEMFAHDPACSDPDAGMGIVPLPSDGGACGLTPPTFGSLSPYHKIPPLAPTGGACTGMPAATIPPSGTKGQSCAYAGALGAGCSGGVCAPSPGIAYSSCVQRAGAVACPPGYPNAHSVGTALNDTRSCGSCACVPATTCTGATLSFYLDSNCQMLTAAVPATGQCVSNPTTTPASYRYSAMANAQCAISTPSAPSGAATVTQASTICCH